MAFYELRQYTVLDGQMDTWLKVMQEEIIPFQVAKGMVIAGSFRGEDNDSVYVWIRRFENQEEKVRLYKEVYESKEWIENIAPTVAKYVDRNSILVHNLSSTPLSVMK